MKKIILLANRKARKLQNNLNIAYEVQSFLSNYFDTILHISDDKENFIRFIKKYSGKSDNLLVSCGGDGTFFTILNSLENHQSILGIIPCGTANSIANELGIPTHHIEAAKVLITGVIRQYDYGVFDKYKFFLSAGIEFDGYVIKNVNAILKKIIGRYSYYIAVVLSYLSYKPHLFEVINDSNQGFKTYFAIFKNISKYVGNLSFANNVYPNDGLLNFIGFKSFTFNTLFKAFVDACRKKNVRNELVYKDQSKKFLVKSKKNFYYQLDGEAFLSSRPEIEIEVCHKKLNLVVV